MTPLLVGMALAGFVVWRSRAVPLAGWRRWLSIGCRIAVLMTLCAASWGAPRRRVVQVARSIVYLADHSASMDAAQRGWMARRIAALEALRPARVKAALISFGGEARLAASLGPGRLDDPRQIRRMLEGAAVAPAQTNLEAAVLYALERLPAANASAPPPASAAPDAPAGSRGQVGVVVLSDGHQTAGEVSRILPAIRPLGVNLFPVAPPSSSPQTIVWEQLAVPPVARRGASVPVRLVVHNAASQRTAAEVAIGVQGIPVKRERVRLRPGWQVVTVAVPALRRGTLALDVQLSVPAHRLALRKPAYIEVEGPPQLLLVTDRTAALPALASALKRQGIDVAVARPGDLTDDPALLLDHDAVLLHQVPKSRLGHPQVEALRTYVERFGGGLIVVGLGGDVAAESTTPSALDALLPVAFEPKGLNEAKRRVCIVLLIDRSASMMGPRLSATKRAAVALVKQLQPEDLAGVFAFDTKPYVVAEVQPAGRISSTLVERLVQLRSTGGTDIYPALVTAADRLERSGAVVKHIILLSDGNTPFHQRGYAALLRALREAGTTVSTIGIGSAFINTDYLEFVATSTGGAFYLMRSLDELPQLIVRDAQSTLGRLPFAEGALQPSTTPTTDWFAGIGQWPPLRGYLTATARPRAQVDLVIRENAPGSTALSGAAARPESHPLLARWSLGQGRVVAFTSDADTRWSPDWVRWPGFDAVWAQVARWAMRSHKTEELFVWVERTAHHARLVLEGRLEDPRMELRAADGKTPAVPLALIQTREARWEAPIEELANGWQHVLVESAASQVVARRWIEVGLPQARSEATGQPPDGALLRQIARATSGMYDAPDAALLPPTAPVSVAQPALTWWLPLVIVLLLIEIGVRGSSML